MNGFLLIDKQQGVTSFDVVRDVRRLSGERKVGHSGTLDPLATGLLLVALGEGTKLLEYFIGCDKEYEVLAHFGAVSNTFDADGSIEEVSGAVVDEKAVIDAITDRFLGKIKQVPPKFSALKVGGRRLCDLVREGGHEKQIEAELKNKVREIEISKFEIVDFNWPLVRFAVGCGSGTYIRSLIHDLGQELEVGGYVQELRRSKVGGFSVVDACTIDELSNKFEQRVFSLEQMVSCFPLLELTDEDCEGLKDGKVLLNKKLDHGGISMAFYKEKLVGVLENFEGGIKYKKVVHVSLS